MVKRLPPRQAHHLAFCSKASAKREGLVTKREGPLEGGRRDSFLLLTALCAQMEREGEGGRGRERERETRLGTRQV